MEESEESSSSSWRFSMELLSHVHTLQVFLFNSSTRVKPEQDCVSLEAVLLRAPPALSCSWKTPDQARLYALRLPLPLLLYDYSASPRILALPDCIQLSLPLLALSPFHLHAFSSMSLAHSGIHTNDPDGICAPNLSAQHEANNGSSHSGDEHKNHACNDTNEIGHAATCTSGSTSDNILESFVYTAADYGHRNDDAHESHEHDDTHALEGLVNSTNDDEELEGAHELEHVAIPLLNKHDYHHNACVKEEDQAGHNIHLVSGHGQSIQRPLYKDSIEACGAQEVMEDAAPASNSRGCHTCSMGMVHADNPVHGHQNRVFVNNDEFKNHEHNESNELQHVAIAALDISASHHHHGTSEVKQHISRAGKDNHRVCSHAVLEHKNICSDNSPMDTSSACFQHDTDGIEAHEHHNHTYHPSFLCDENEASKGGSQCQNGSSAANLQNNGSSRPKQHHNSMVLDSLKHQGLEDQKSQGATNFHCKKCSVKVSKNPVRSLVQLPCFDWREITENWFGACCCSFGTEAEVLSASFEKSLKSRPGKCLVGSSTFYVNFSDVTVETNSVTLNIDNEIRPLSTLHFLALGNGFMVWENQRSKYFSWLPVYCTCCASLLGAYACKSADSGLMWDGLHLFRCQVTALNADGSLDDMLRYATFKELLAKELRSRTEENTTYRFLIRSLSSQLPILQLVVLDYDSLICTGHVTTHILNLKEHTQTTNEMTASVGEALQRSIKVLFLDCTGISANEIRSTERWARDYDAETIFMLEEFVDVLKGELSLNRVFYPAACGLSQVFHGSFLYMTQE